MENRSLSQPIVYENYGLPLNNKLYGTYELFSHVSGFVIQVNIRLFNEWKGNVSLYLFVLANRISGFSIVHRYAVNPKPNTTDWQIISVPFRALPISLGSLLAVGMQDTGNGVNEVQAVKVPYSVRGDGINEKTINFTHTMNGFIAPALSYTIIHFRKELFIDMYSMAFIASFSSSIIDNVNICSLKYLSNQDSKTTNCSYH